MQLKKLCCMYFGAHLPISLLTQCCFSCIPHILWRRQWHPTPVLLPGKSHGQRSLEGCSPWGREESDTTERLHFHFSLSCIGEGHGNPLQCSCLENPRYGEPGGLPSMGSHRVEQDWSDLAAAAAAAKSWTWFQLNHHHQHQAMYLHSTTTGKA